MVYAIVRAGGRQEKVEVGTIVTMNRIKASSGSIELPAVLLVDGDKVTSDSQSLSKVKVVAEVLDQLRGPKISIQKYKKQDWIQEASGSPSRLDPRPGHRDQVTRS